MVTHQVIDISNVQIQTATIEVKSVRIGTRQMTQSVFRQLWEQPIIHEDPDLLPCLLGTPWGIVNHCDCHGGPDRSNHVHVIWQVGDELRKARVSRQIPQTSAYVKQLDDGGRYVEYAIVNHLLGRSFVPEGWSIEVTGAGMLPAKMSVANQDERLVVPYPGISTVAATRRAIIWGDDDPPLVVPPTSALRDRVRGAEVRTDPPAPNVPHEYRRLLQDFPEQHPSASRFAEAWIHLAQRHAAWLADYKRRYGALYSELSALDQLFIAV